MPSRNYSDLIAWQRAVDLVEHVYLVTKVMPESERYGLTSNLLSVAHGSVRELETHVILAGRLKFLDAAQTEAILQRAGEVGRLVTGLANSLKARTTNQARRP
jgi:hypothetical protein